MSVIQVTNLTFAYDGSYDTIFEHVSFQIDSNWKTGLTGRNGRGKTTLLSLLLGRYPYQGEISASVEFSYFPEPIQREDAPVRHVLAEIAPQAEEWELMRELSLLELSEEMLDRPFSTLSPGEQTKIHLAALFCLENAFLLIDEPTNHLDAAGRELLAAYLKRKQGFLLVSHDRAFLDGCVDHMLALNKTSIEVQRGNFTSWWKNKARQQQFEQEKQEKLRQEASRLSTAASRTKGWSDVVEKRKYHSDNSGLKVDRGYVGHKSAKMMKRSKLIQRRRQEALEETTQLLRDAEREESLAISPLSYHAARLLEAKDLTISYGEHPLFYPITFTVSQGDRVALVGKNGCGKSSVLKLILGQAISYQGQLLQGSQLRISYVSQYTDHLSGGLNAYAQTHEVEETQMKTILRKLGFSREQFDKDLSEYSAGQKKKVLLARSLCQRAHLYLWDEPLNFVDVLSRMQLEDLILTYRPTLLFVEHDHKFCQTIATRQIAMEPCR